MSTTRAAVLVAESGPALEQCLQGALNSGFSVHGFSPPTHLALITWEGIHWPCILRADNTGVVIERGLKRDQAVAALFSARMALDQVGIAVRESGYFINEVLGEPPVRFEGDANDEDIDDALANPDFVQWLRGMIDVWSEEV